MVKDKDNPKASSPKPSSENGGQIARQKSSINLTSLTAANVSAHTKAASAGTDSDTGDTELMPPPRPPPSVAGSTASRKRSKKAKPCPRCQVSDCSEHRATWLLCFGYEGNWPCVAETKLKEDGFTDRFDRAHAHRMALERKGMPLVADSITDIRKCDTFFMEIRDNYIAPSKSELEAQCNARNLTFNEKESKLLKLPTSRTDVNFKGRVFRDSSSPHTQYSVVRNVAITKDEYASMKEFDCDPEQSKHFLDKLTKEYPHKIVPRLLNTTETLEDYFAALQNPVSAEGDPPCTPENSDDDKEVFYVS